MSKRQNFVTVIFRSNNCINTYFIDSWNLIYTKTAQDDIMAIYDVKYENIWKKNSGSFNIFSDLYLEEAPGEWN